MMEHIEIWKARKAKRKEAVRIERDREDREEAKITRQFREILAEYDVMEMVGDSYVYEFEYRGWAYRCANQWDRLCCQIRRPFLSDMDEDRFKDERMQRGDDSPLLVSEYGYRHFNIDGEPIEAFRKLLEY